MPRPLHRSSTCKQLGMLMTLYKPLTMADVRTASGGPGKPTGGSTEPQHAELTTLQSWNPRIPTKPIWCRTNGSRRECEFWKAHIEELRSISVDGATSCASNDAIHPQLAAVQRHHKHAQRIVGLNRYLRQDQSPLQSAAQRYFLEPTQ